MLQRLNADNATQDKAQAALRAYVERLYSSPNENYRKYADEVWTYNCAFVANLHNTMTAVQRKNAVKKLKDWETEIRALLPGPGMETIRANSSFP
jgi:cyclopropane fatty-acyl-phospholipid synthase-like methyltransferase